MNTTDRVRALELGPATTLGPGWVDVWKDRVAVRSDVVLSEVKRGSLTLEDQLGPPLQIIWRDKMPSFVAMILQHFGHTPDDYRLPSDELTPEGQ